MTHVISHEMDVCIGRNIQFRSTVDEYWWMNFPSSHNHGSVEKWVYLRISYLSKQSHFHWTMIMREKTMDGFCPSVISHIYSINYKPLTTESRYQNKDTTPPHQHQNRIWFLELLIQYPGPIKNPQIWLPPKIWEVPIAYYNAFNFKI